MSKVVNNSYLDWELNFRKRNLKKDFGIKKVNPIQINKKINSIGIADSDFRNFMKKWKKENIK